MVALPKALRKLWHPARVAGAPALYSLESWMFRLKRCQVEPVEKNKEAQPEPRETLIAPGNKTNCLAASKSSEECEFVIGDACIINCGVGPSNGA